MSRYYTPREANNLLEIAPPMVAELMGIGERIREQWRQPGVEQSTVRLIVSRLLHETQAIL